VTFGVRLLAYFVPDLLWRWKRRSVALGEATSLASCAHEASCLLSELRQFDAAPEVLARVEEFSDRLAKRAGLAAAAFTHYSRGL
jgi:hypothetical protein